MAEENRVTDRAEVMTALTDPAFTMPPVPSGGPVPGIRWLRQHVVRFADGADHERRRALVTDLLAGVAAAGLRPAARERATALLADEKSVNVMTRLARVVPIEVLTTALGLPDVSPDIVAIVATSYQPNPAIEEQPADEAVGQLVTAFGGTADELTAAKISLLVQTCDATAGLVGSAVVAALRSAGDADQAVADALAQQAPAQITRRQQASTGTLVTIDLAGNELPFGAGPHQCPGGDHAVAMAAGVVDALAGWTLADQDIEYEPSPALRVPKKVVVTR